MGTGSGPGAGTGSRRAARTGSWPRVWPPPDVLHRHDWGMSRWFQTYGFADVFPNLLIGAYPLDRRDVGMLANMGVQRVLNLVEDQEYRPEERAEVVEAMSSAGIDEQRLSL